MEWDKGKGMPGHVNYLKWHPAQTCWHTLSALDKGKGMHKSSGLVDLVSSTYVLTDMHRYSRDIGEFSCKKGGKLGILCV